jgi:hypothetical protein
MIEMAIVGLGSWGLCVLERNGEALPFRGAYRN